MLTVRDDGIGFEQEMTDGNGLSSMHRRAGALNGSFQIDSQPGEGTEIRLRVSQKAR